MTGPGGGYDAGDAFLNIIPSFRGVDAAIRREAAKWGGIAGDEFDRGFQDRIRRSGDRTQLGPGPERSRQQGDDSAGAFGRAFTERLRAAMRAIPKVEVDADSTPAERKLQGLRRQLEELSTKRVGVDLDEAEAQRKLAGLRRELDDLARKSPTVNVRADTAAARAELDRLRADIRRIPDVDVNTKGALAKVAALRNAVAGLQSSPASVSVDVVTGPALAAIRAIGVALTGLAAGAVITPVIGGLAGLAGPGAALGGGVAGFAATAAPGISSITKALQAQQQAQAGAGAAAGKSARQQTTAADQIKSAEMSLADTRRQIANDQINSAEQIANAQRDVDRARAQAAQQVAQADQQVTTAEKELAQAQRDTLAAQKALTDAEEQGRRSLQDSAFAAQDAALSLQDARIAVQEAQANLDALNAPGKGPVTDLQRQQAELALAEAQQRLREQTVNTSRAVEDNNKAQAAGVAGSAPVVAAQDAITRAQQRQQAAAEALRQAQQSRAQAVQQGNQQIADAERRLADARRQAQQQAAADASSLRRAEMALAQAHQSATQSAGAQSAATSKLGDAMAALTPQEHVLMDAFQTLKARYIAFSHGLEPIEIPVETKALEYAGRLLPVVRPLIVATVRALAQVEDQIGRALTGPGMRSFVGILSQLAGPTVHAAAAVLLNIGSAIGAVVKRAAPLSGVVEGGLVHLSDALDRAARSPGLGRFLRTMQQLAPTVVDTVKAVGGLGARLLGALAPLAGPTLRVIGTLARTLRQLVAAVGPSLTRMFAQLAPVLTDLITQLLPPLTGFIQQVADAVPDVARGLADVLIALTPLLPIVGSLLRYLGPIIQFLAPLAPYIAAVVGAVKLLSIAMAVWEVLLPILTTEVETLDVATGELTVTLLANPIGIVVVALAALVAGFILAYKHSETFRKIVQTVWHAVAAVAQWAWRNILKPVFEFIFLYYKTLWKIAVAAFHGIVTAWRATSSWFADRWRAFAGFTSRIWHDITGGVTRVFRAMGGALRDAWHAVSGWLSDRWHAFAGVAARIWRGITGGIKSAFGSIEGFFVGVWHRVETIFAGAVNFVSQHIINPLIGLLDKVLGVFGVHIGKIPAIHIGAPSAGSVATATPGGHGVAGGTAYYAHGGREPGYAPGQDTRLVRVSPGEGFVVPEAVEALGRMMGVSGEAAINYLNEALSPRVRAARGGMRMRGGTPHFFLGGVLSAVGHALGSVVSGIRNVAADVAYAGLRTAEAPIRAVLGGLAPGSFVARIANGIFDRINNAIRSFISGHAGENMASIGPSVGGAGTLAIFRNLMSMLHLTAAQAAGVMGNMWAESGFNPYIVQGGGTSMNPAAAGGGGYGLVQWTPGSKLIPLLHGQPPSIISEIRALGEQLAGSESSAGRALRAASTPEAAAAVFGLQYERYAGPPQAARSSEARAIYNRFAHLDSGGWLPPGATTVFNLTGQPELVLNPAQQRNLLNRPATQFEQNIYPQAGQSEYEIGNVAANAILFRLRTS